jgi:hypothetical protein
MLRLIEEIASFFIGFCESIGTLPNQNWEVLGNSGLGRSFLHMGKLFSLFNYINSIENKRV